MMGHSRTDTLSYLYKSLFFSSIIVSLADVSGFAQVLDYITLMNYDVWGSLSKHVRPNAPLNDTCTSSANRQGSAISAIKVWTRRHAAINQIVLGVASHGYSFKVFPSAACESGKKTLAAYPAFEARSSPWVTGDAWDDTSSADVCG
ncbi:hypothetical protein BDR07DRAFT_640344 [Suillus spraguei]|nr:hypothetical protein BDR07DRAFT_640344 [Suillus spraguei]